jgi:eukaryotic-like serine/threonine-protein kinase
MAQRRSISLILPLLVVAVLLFGGWSWLRLYTRHGVAMRVPELQGLTLEEATVMLEKRDLRALVIDSVYTDDLPKGSVVDQDPDPE